MNRIRSPHLWIILAILIILGIMHYAEQIGLPGTLPPSEHFGLTRHALDRALFLIPIIYAALVFGLNWGLTVCGISLVVMLPRVVVLSPAPGDAVLETLVIIFIGALVSAALWKRASERDQFRHALKELEEAHKQLQHYFQVASSEEKRFLTLNKISTVLAESLQLEELLRKAIQLVMDIMEVEVGLIYSLEEETKELVLAAYDGVSENFADEVKREKLGEGFNGRVAKTGEPLIVKDVNVDPVTNVTAVKEMKLVSEMIVPMTFKDRIVGTIWVAQRRPRDFQASDVDLLTAIGNQLAASITNARLYEEERQIAGQLSVAESKYRELFEKANDSILVHNLEGRIIEANNATEELTGYSREGLLEMNITDFLTGPSLDLASQVRRKLFEKEPVEQPYEISITRRDGTKAILKLTSNLVTSEGKVTGFQHIARDVTRERKMQDNLRFYLEQLTRAREEEGKRIARKLNEDTVQSLSAVAANMDKYMLGKPSLSDEESTLLKKLREQIDTTLQSVRRFTQQLRPPRVEEAGLLPALKLIATDIARSYGFKARVNISGIERRLSAETELMIFRIVQEALKNAAKHAQASEVEINVDFGRNKMRVSIADNGKGFQLKGKTEDLASTGKLGLAGMYERAQLLGGNLEINSAPGQGTTVVLDAPV